MYELFSWVLSLALAAALALLIRRCLFTLITVKGNSMLDTLHGGDRLYISILTPRLTGYEHGDIVICRYPGRRDLCIKRVIGLPGDTVSIESGTVFINGEALDEPYLTRHASYSWPEYTLEDDEFFLLGDNRPISHDSHSFDVGPVTDIVGVARAILWPPGRIGRPD